MMIKIIFFAFVILCLLLLCVGIIDGNRFRVVEENVTLDHISSDFRFVFISDLHNKVYGKHNERLIEEVRKANPEFIVIAGDLITAHVEESMQPAIDLMQALNKEYDIYYALGNHETKVRVCTNEFHDQYQTYMEQIQTDKTKMLVNDSIVLEQYHAKIYGLELERYYFSKFKKRNLTSETLCKHIGTPDTSMCNILIAHNPDYFEEYARWGADFVLSGHVHGGIMRLPVLGGVISPAYQLFPKYDGGIFQKDHATMLLGRGMGAHTIPLRFFNPAELYIVNCLRK